MARRATGFAAAALAALAAGSAVFLMHERRAAPNSLPGSVAPAASASAPSERQKTYVISARLPASSLPELYVSLIYGSAIGIRFRAPVAAEAVRGGLYSTVIDPESKQSDLDSHRITISICSTRTGALEDIGLTRVGSSTVTVPARRRTRAVRRLPFTVRCRLEGGRHYWLVVEPGWTEDRSHAPTRSVDFVRRETGPEDGVIRTFVTPNSWFGSTDRWMNEGDWSTPWDRHATGLWTDLELLSPS